MTAADAARPPVDLSRCADEPIHVPGSIQPHGVLIALREPDLAILQVSENVETLLGRSHATVLDHRLEELVGRPAGDEVRSALAREPVQEQNPLGLRIGDMDLDAIVHRHQGITILELEPRTEPRTESLSALGHVVRRLHGATVLDDVQRIAVDEIRALTGYDHVLLYRFDVDGHGEVVAEAKGDDLAPYLGLHYPATDIPRQARDLYRANWIRIIPDAAYDPVPIVPTNRPDTGAPLDLSYAVLRSVSPVHREFMRNFGMRASMSISILARDELAGLITCLHRTPRYVPYAMRAVCETIGRLVSLQLRALEEVTRSGLRRERLAVCARLAGAIREANDDEMLARLLTRPDDLLTVVSATGAAVMNGDDVRTVGICPPAPAILDLCRSLDATLAGDLLELDCVSSSYPPGEAFTANASGVLAVALPTPERRAVLWFRPELVRTVHWAGDPDKPVDVDPESMSLHPRRSFEVWKQIVRGHSAKWREVDVEAARDLRRTAIEVDLALRVRREEAAVRARDDIVAIVSHDLRNPLGAVQMQASLLSQAIPRLGEEVARQLRGGVERIQRAAHRMSTLVDALLDVAQIESGRFHVEPSPQQATALVDEALGMLEPLARRKSVALARSFECDDRVLADPDRVFQVLSNIVGNAVKFTPPGGAVRVTVRRIGGDVEVAVRDEGPGIPEADRVHLFERYWQGRPRGASGVGLGLYIARGIVDAHGGRIVVESEVGAGSTFRIMLPVAG
jgi:light-regulated signal transduction histidine kinase (bacteriophytochrome)